MNDLLIHPAFQGGVAPFVLAFIVAWVTSKKHLVWCGLAVIAAFILTTSLITGLSLEPLSSTRKILLLAIAATIIGFVIQLLAPKKMPVLTLLVVVSIAAVLWVTWPVLSRKETSEALLLGGGVSLYCAVITSLFIWQNQKLIPLSSAALSLGLCTGGASIIGASALLGQLSMSLGVAAAAILLIQLFSQQQDKPNHLFSIAFSIPVALLAVAATVYAQLPWYVLVVLCFQPIMVRVPLPEKLAAWQKASAYVCLAMIPGMIALYLTWQAAGPVLM